MIGKVIKAGVIPSGFVLKSKGVKESVYLEILTTIASLKSGEAIEITQDELEAKMAKALPKFFKANLRKKLQEKFGKTGVEMVELASEGAKKVIYQIQRLTTEPVPTATK